MNLVKRFSKPTPQFFIRLRNISLSIAALSACILIEPAGIPSVLVKIAGCIIIAGITAGLVSQLVTHTETGEPLKANTIGTAFPQR